MPELAPPCTSLNTKLLTPTGLNWALAALAKKALRLVAVPDKRKPSAEASPNATKSPLAATPCAVMLCALKAALDRVNLAGSACSSRSSVPVP